MCPFLVGGVATCYLFPALNNPLDGLVYTHTYIHIHTYIHTHTYTHTYTHIYTHIHTYTHIFINDCPEGGMCCSFLSAYIPMVPQ
jgi:hypothetical protein